MNIERYRTIPFTLRNRCLACDAAADSPLISLPRFPITEVYVPQKPTEVLGHVDQSFHLCPQCGHGQLGRVIDPEFQYGAGSGYYYRTSTSPSGRIDLDFFLAFLNRVLGNRPLANVLEIGCNDLCLLKSLAPRARRLVGVDPILKNIPVPEGTNQFTLHDGFFEDLEFAAEHDVVICKDTLEHVADPAQFLRKTLAAATPGAWFFFQFPCLDTLVAGCRFDQIFHQHVNYFSFASICHLLARLGCTPVDFAIDYDHWGTLAIAFRKGSDRAPLTAPFPPLSPSGILERYTSFQADLDHTALRLAQASGESRYGYGAALMLPVLAYHLHTDFRELRAVVDDDPNKAGLYYINLPVPVAPSSAVSDLRDSTVLVTAIASRRNAMSILQKLFAIRPRHILYPLRTL